jgi:hypothetical protein
MGEQEPHTMEVRNTMFGREFLWYDVARKTLQYWQWINMPNVLIIFEAR